MTESPAPGWARLTDPQIGDRLHALGADLAPDVDITDRVLAAIESHRTVEPTRSQRRRRLAVAAVVIFLAGTTVVAIAPARTAVANWLGIGNTSIGMVDELPPAEPLDAPPQPPSGEVVDPTLVRRAARADAEIAIRLPDPEVVGTPVAWEIRQTDSVREVIIAWDEFTLSAREDEGAALTRKLVPRPEAVTTPVLSNGLPAIWIDGPHARIEGDAPALVEATLIWVDEGIEYRLSGDLTEARAVDIASSFG